MVNQTHLKQEGKMRLKLKSFLSYHTDFKGRKVSSLYCNRINGSFQLLFTFFNVPSRKSSKFMHVIFCDNLR